MTKKQKHVPTVVQFNIKKKDSRTGRPDYRKFLFPYRVYAEQFARGARGASFGMSALPRGAVKVRKKRKGERGFSEIYR